MYQNHIGINLTETKFQFVEISYKQKSFYLENIDQIIFKENLSPSLQKGFNIESESKIISLLQESYNKIISKKNPISKFISFSLANEFFVVIEIPFEPTLIKKDLNEHFKWELSVLYPHLKSEDYLIQHIEVNKTSIRTEEVAIVFYLNKNVINIINKFCKVNNLELKYVDNAHLASTAFLHILDEKKNNDITFSFYIDQKLSSLAVLEGRIPFFFKTFDTIKILDIIDDILLQLNRYGVNINSANQIIINGQNITDEVILKLEEKFNRKLIKINPFEKLKINDSFKNNPFYISQYNSFMAATGMALRVI
ncbi:hypothetical protein [Rosettibacter firmus]|uniref:hypothetical protein n=1 Tax=Rosettibacter firmus TaxID=3111522 RepID=UPI00336BBA26